jgi:ABC-type branched-subunit amino acid transport system substrate-binding protein
MNSNDLLAIIDRVKAGSLDEEEIQAIVDAVKSKRIILEENSKSAIIGGNTSRSLTNTGNGNTIIFVSGDDAKTLEDVVKRHKKEHGTINQEASKILNRFTDILMTIWRPLLFGSSGFFILFLLLNGILRLVQCKFSLECPNPVIVSPSSSSSQIESPHSTVLKAEQTDKFISAGEKPISGSISLSGKYETLKQDGIKQFSQGRYEDAHKNFKSIRDEASKQRNSSQRNSSLVDSDQALKDPEILIYQNNSEVRRRHEKGEPIYTIAVATPLSTKNGDVFSIGQQILFGIAQAQDKAVNKLERKINLEIVIANDLNDENQAQAVAQRLVDWSGEDGRKIRAVIGHYTSPVTCGALPIYDKAKFVVISSTSSRSNQREACRNVHNFFRTVTSNTLEAQDLASYISNVSRSGISEPKVFAFYNYNEGFSKDLFEQFKKAIQGKANIIREIDLSKVQDVNEALKSLNEANVFAVFPDGKTGGDDHSYTNALKVINTTKLIKNKDIKILGSNPLYQQEAVNINGDIYLEDKLVIAVDWHSKCSDKDFLATAKKTWVGGVNRFTASAYEAVQVLLSSFESSDRGKNLSKYLYNNNAAPESDVFKDKRIKISFSDNGDRKDISHRILVTPRKSGDDSFDLIEENSCENQI